MRTEQRHDKIRQILVERMEKRETPSFISEFFKTFAGKNYHSKNPPEVPSEEVKMRMAQRIERNKQQRERGEDGESVKPTDSVERSNDMVMVGDNMEDRDNPIVALEPDELKQGSNFLGSKKANSSIQHDASAQGGLEQTVHSGATLPSLYMQEKLYLYNKDQEALLKAEEHHIVKTKDFNVYGRLREDMPKVKSIVKSQAASELNEKFITTECITDRRVKISSQAPRYYMNAPGVEDVRKQGQH